MPRGAELNEQKPQSHNDSLHNQLYEMRLQKILFNLALPPANYPLISP